MATARCTAAERVWLYQAKTAQSCGCNLIYDIFEGTAEIQQLVISRAISGCTSSSYHACVAPQCGQETVVETAAMKKCPQAHG